MLLVVRCLGETKKYDGQEVFIIFCYHIVLIMPRHVVKIRFSHIKKIPTNRFYSLLKTRNIIGCIHHDLGPCSELLLMLSCYIHLACSAGNNFIPLRESSSWLKYFDLTLDQSYISALSGSMGLNSQTIICHLNACFTSDHQTLCSLFNVRPVMGALIMT